MYIPKHFEQNDPVLLMEVMRTHTFATLVSIVDRAPFATHLPLLATQDEHGLRIQGHFARANPHWHALAAEPSALAIFHGPHTYISPTLYKSEARVPTWNYITVHASGTIALEHGNEAKLSMLTSLIAHHEAAYQAQFDRIEEKLREGLLDAIVAFTMTVDKIEGKFKLGQNRLTDNRHEMRETFESGGKLERDLAEWMRRLGYWDNS